MKKIFCDFDGTISVDCSVDYVLERLADPEWETIEAAWVAGKIGSAECMQRQIALIRASRAELDAVLDQVEIDPSFPAFVEYCRAQGDAITVVSDGVDYFIRRILNHFGISDLPIYANQMYLTTEGMYRLTSPYASGNGSGTCKSGIIGNHQQVIFIGDGRSDFAVASQSRANMSHLFTKAKLTTYCLENGIPHTSYGDFHNIIKELETSNTTQHYAQMA